MILLVCYIAVLAYVCFFSERYGRTVSDTYHYNLMPFREISRFYTYREIIGFRGVCNQSVWQHCGIYAMGLYGPGDR